MVVILNNEEFVAVRKAIEKKLDKLQKLAKDFKYPRENLRYMHSLSSALSCFDRAEKQSK